MRSKRKSESFWEIKELTFEKMNRNDEEIENDDEGKIEAVAVKAAVVVVVVVQQLECDQTLVENDQKPKKIRWNRKERRINEIDENIHLQVLLVHQVES